MLYPYFSALSLLLIFMFSSESLFGATIVVGPPPASIQTAINSAISGDTIQLSAGTYIEQIQVISKSLNIVGTGQNSTIIQAPGPATPLTQFFNIGAPNIWPVFMVDNLAAPAAQVVNISDLTVDGDNQQDTSTLPPPSSGQYSFTNRFFGIGYHNAGGTIQNVHVTNTRSSANFSQLAGGGIVNIVSSGTATFNVTNCLVDFYQRNGVVVMGATLTANISGTTVNRGYVLTPSTVTATPNGITFGGSATGSITNNIVQSNIATVLGASATAVNIPTAGPNLIVSGNVITNNDIGMFATQCGNNLSIQNNTLNFNTTPGVNVVEGIIVRDTNGLTTLTANVMNLPNFNMELLTINGTNQPFQLMNNQFIGGQTGLLVYGLTGAPSTGPIITMNGDSFTGTSGYYIQEVTAPNTAPNDIWPSTATVSFDGLISGHMTLAEFNQVLTKIFDKHNDPTLGLVLDFIVPSPPLLSSVVPSSGPSTGGNRVTITGSGFISSNTSVYFGASPGTDVVVVSDTEITVTAPAGVGTVDVTVSTSFGITPIVTADQYTYISTDLNPLPPTNFVGLIKKNRFLNKTTFVLSARWEPSPSVDVIFYRIYKKGIVIDEISARSPLVFRTNLSNSSHPDLEIAAVNADRLESSRLKIKMCHE